VDLHVALPKVVRDDHKHIILEMVNDFILKDELEGMRSCVFNSKL
jgi:hypothetical protein